MDHLKWSLVCGRYMVYNQSLSWSIRFTTIYKFKAIWIILKNQSFTCYSACQNSQMEVQTNNRWKPIHSGNLDTYFNGIWSTLLFETLNLKWTCRYTTSLYRSRRRNFATNSPGSCLYCSTHSLHPINQINYCFLHCAESSLYKGLKRSKNWIQI